jgi:anaerobic selenocysteine-containing dehydrogenase
MGVAPLPVYREPPVTPVSAPELAREYPLILTNSGKIREFFHSEGRQIDSLRRSNPDPLLEIHPNTAAGLNVGDGDWVWIETRNARVKMRAKFFEGIAEDVVAAQFGWWFPEKEPPEYAWKECTTCFMRQITTRTLSESLHSDLCKVSWSKPPYTKS